MTLLEVRNLSAGYGQFQALFDVSLNVNEGAAIAVIGANGAGKSTLLKSIAGVVDVNFGEIIFDGESIVNFLSHREESGLQCIICLALHAANLRYTTLFTTTFDLRRHVTLRGKSPEPVSFAAEATLGMIIVPTTGVFPGKVFCTKCTEEEFVIGQVLRCSGMQLLYLCFS